MEHKRVWVSVLLAGALAIGTIGCSGNVHDESSGESEYQTSVASLGDLTVSAYGVGTLIGSSTEDVAFQSEGEILELNVQVGSQVAVGDVLAVIDSASAELALEEASAQLSQAEMNWKAAQAEYDALAALDYDPELADAEAALVKARENLEEVTAGPTDGQIASARTSLLKAEDSYQSLVDGPSASEIESAQLSLDKAKNSLWSTQNSRDTTLGNANSSQADINRAEASVLNAEISVREAEMKLEELLEPATDLEKQVAWASVLSAQEALDDLLAQPTAQDIAEAEQQLLDAQIVMSGTTDGQSLLQADIALRQASVAYAEAQDALEAAEEALEATTLITPIDGIVTKMAYEVGDEVQAGQSITVVDTVHPYIQVYLDESDFGNVRVGYEADVVFDAMPEVTYTGTVAQVGAELVNVSGVDAVEVQVDLDTGETAMALGMNAEVDIIGGRATDAVLVPYEAVREISDDQYVVFVVEDGELVMRPVTVGLSDYMTAEILSGVEVDEVVSTGNVATNLNAGE